MDVLSVLALLRNPWVLLAIVGIAGLAGTGWYRMRYHDCEAARAEDRVKAEQAKSAALEKAKETSDRIITEQAQALAESAAKAGGIIERIIHVPVTTVCRDTPAMRAATDGVRELLAPRGGQGEAGGKSPPAVQRSNAGR